MAGRFSRQWLEERRVDPATLGAVEVIGNAHVVRELDTIAARLREPGRARALGLQAPRGVLLWGAPGTGRTHAARHLAKILGEDVAVYELAPDELDPGRLRGTVRALSADPGDAVVLIDEIDTFALHRDSPNHEPRTRALLSAALGVLDGLAPRQGPLLVATSNRPPGALDPALIRQGRFDLVVAVGTPTEPERLAQLEYFAAALPLEDEVDLGRAAGLSRYMTPADLKGILADAAALAFAQGRSTVDEASLRQALERAGSVWPEPEPIEETLSEALRRRLAVHEAGHCLAIAVQYGVGRIRSVRIGPFGGDTVRSAEGRDVVTEHDLFCDLVNAFAGVTAEREILGEPGTGSREDFAVATETAVRRVALGLGYGAPPIDPEALGMDMPPRLLDLIGADIEAQFDNARGRAEDIVRAHLDTIDVFARVLAAEGELIGDAVRDAFVAAGFAVPGVDEDEEAVA